MQFRVERDMLGDAVAWVARALPARPVIPVLSGMLVQAADDGVTLSCFDYEISARVSIRAAVPEAGTALVPGRLLAEIVRSLPGLPVDVSLTADMVTLTCGGAEFEIVSLPLDEYPALPELPGAAGTVDSAMLAAAAAQVVPSASKDDTLPMLTAVCMDIDGPAMTLAGTDRYRLAVRTLDWRPARPGQRIIALVPARTLAEAARSMAGAGTVSIAFSAVGDAAEAAGAAGAAGGPGADSGTAAAAGGTDIRAAAAAMSRAAAGQIGAKQQAGRAPADPKSVDGLVSFEGGDRRLTARLIGGEYIKYAARFPAEFGCRAELPAAQFTEAVRRVSLVADRVSPVRLAFGPDSVSVQAETNGRARAAESVPATFAGTEQVISFAPHYLLDGLAAAAVSGEARQATAGDDEEMAVDAAAAGEAAARPDVAGPGLVRLEFTSSAKPALITWVEVADSEPTTGAASSFRYLVVPLRVPTSG